ncbi:MAG: hypothetical protein ABR976_19900 [Terracidiphilus sp.]|jgi:uncharacterized membrane protein
MPDEWKPLTGLEELSAANQPQAGPPPFSQTQAAKTPQPSAAENAVPSVDGHAAFARGLLYGTAVAVVGLPVYYLSLFLCGLYVGFIALPVAWLVGKAIKKGSRGDGCLRYQIAAVLLTYMAVCVLSIPVVWSSYIWTYKTTEIPWGLILFMGTYAPLFQFQRGFFGIIAELSLFAALYVAYRITADTRRVAHT